MPVVIDNSVSIAWCMSDENAPIADKAMSRVVEEGGVVPGIWWYELRNALLMNERRGRISRQQVADTLVDSQSLGISVDHKHDETLILELAQQFDLTIYDAAYLEVALRRSLPLATLDERLRQAAEAVGIAIVGAHD